MQMTSWEVEVAGSSFSRLLDRSSVCRWRRPHGKTEGKDTRQLDDRSRWTIREDKSMNQSSSSQGSCRQLQQTLTACRHRWEKLLLLLSFAVMLFCRSDLFSIHAGLFLKCESQQVFTEGWMVHEHVGGEPCSILQQELSDVLLSCNTKRTTQSETITSVNMFCKSWLSFYPFTPEGVKISSLITSV